MINLGKFARKFLPLPLSVLTSFLAAHYGAGSIICGFLWTNGLASKIFGNASADDWVHKLNNYGNDTLESWSSSLAWYVVAPILFSVTLVYCRKTFGGGKLWIVPQLVGSALLVSQILRSTDPIPTACEFARWSAMAIAVSILAGRLTTMLAEAAARMRKPLLFLAPTIVCTVPGLIGIESYNREFVVYGSMLLATGFLAGALWSGKNLSIALYAAAAAVMPITLCDIVALVANTVSITIDLFGQGDLLGIGGGLGWRAIAGSAMLVIATPAISAIGGLAGRSLLRLLARTARGPLANNH